MNALAMVTPSLQTMGDTHFFTMRTLRDQGSRDRTGDRDLGPAELRRGDMRRGMMMSADRSERAHDLGVAHRLSWPGGENNVVHRDDAHHRAAESLDRQSPQRCCVIVSSAA